MKQHFDELSVNESETYGLNLFKINKGLKIKRQSSLKTHLT